MVGRYLLNAHWVLLSVVGGLVDIHFKVAIKLKQGVWLQVLKSVLIVTPDLKAGKQYISKVLFNEQIPPQFCHAGSAPAKMVATCTL